MICETCLHKEMCDEKATMTNYIGSMMDARPLDASKKFMADFFLRLNLGVKRK